MVITNNFKVARKINLPYGLLKLINENEGLKTNQIIKISKLAVFVFYRKLKTIRQFIDVKKGERNSKHLSLNHDGKKLLEILDKYYNK